jgi:hypothetical protein
MRHERSFLLDEQKPILVKGLDLEVEKKDFVGTS